MRTTQSGHEWCVDEDGDIRCHAEADHWVFLDEMDLVGMLRKVRLARMAKKTLEDLGLTVIDSGVSKS